MNGLNLVPACPQCDICYNQFNPSSCMQFSLHQASSCAECWSLEGWCLIMILTNKCSLGY
jgi:hypothetical protein